ncbi:hypothetical protein MYEC719_p40004 (plasmid) [Escherichia coli]|nr:hypothetical protein MYEC719_p40004 [Escherichia coli]
MLLTDFNRTVSTHSPTPIKTPQFCSIFFDLSKPTSLGLLRSVTYC